MDDEKAHEERHEPAVLNCSDASFEPPWRRARTCECSREGKVVAERKEGPGGLWIAFAFGKGRGPRVPSFPEERGYRFRFTGRRLFGEENPDTSSPLVGNSIRGYYEVRVRVRATIRVFKGALHDMDPFQITVRATSSLGSRLSPLQGSACCWFVVHLFPPLPLGCWAPPGSNSPGPVLFCLCSLLLLP